MIRMNNDYNRGCIPEILTALANTNGPSYPGYGTDEACEAAANLLRSEIGWEDADIHFLPGATQANFIVHAAALRPIESVIAAQTGHIVGHEAGSVENTGHQILAQSCDADGKLRADQVRAVVEAYEAGGAPEHLTEPRLVYISQPTEYGALYTLEELQAIKDVCEDHDLLLFVDGARLAYALGAANNDVTLWDLAALCDVFTIGGTKCGALFGEAVVITVPGLIPHFFTIIKQHGALLAKGRLLGIQFDTLFTNHLYEHIGKSAISAADQIRAMLKSNGFQLCYDSPTNQIFCIIDNSVMDRLLSQVECSFWEKYDDSHTVIRFVTSWATTQEDVQRLGTVLSF